MKILRLLCLVLCAVIVVHVAPANSETLPTPTERVVLLVNGNISEVNLGNAAIFDLPMLMALGAETFSSKTQWTEGTPTFTGVPLSALIKKVGATGSEIIVTAADGYAISLPMSDLEKFDVLLVHTMNDLALKPSEKGPLWIMYRWDRMTAEEIEDKSPNAVWQLQQLTFE